MGVGGKGRLCMRCGEWIGHGELSSNYPGKDCSTACP